jgi:hypothetical protein
MKERLGKMGTRTITIGTKKPRKKAIVCSGCHFLAFVEGMPPLCLARVTYIDSSLYRRLDITGIDQAETVNKKLDCKLREGFSLRAIGLQRRIKSDCRKKGVWYGRRAKR